MKLFADFVAQYDIKYFAKGELILVQGEVPSNAFIIKKGIIKTYNLTAQGEEKPITYDVRNEVFPITWIFSKLSESQFFYEAFTDVELYAVPREAYKKFLKENPAYLYEAHSFLVSSYANLMTRINALEQSKASTKVVNTIHYLCLRYGTAVRQNLVRIQLPMTQQELANFMGMTRETASIELKKLQRDGVLTYRRQNYIVNTSKLDDLLDDDYEQAKIEDADISNRSL